MSLKQILFLLFRNTACFLEPLFDLQVILFARVFVCRFMNVKMRSMVFEDSLFEECYFEDITSSNTFFKNCTFIATLFYNTGEEFTHSLLVLDSVVQNLKALYTALEKTKIPLH